jgi:anti-anti-sigma factor
MSVVDDSLRVSVKSASGDAPTIVELAGEIDISTAHLLDDAFASLSPDQRVVADLCDVEFMDSTGLRALIQFANRARESGGQLSVVATHPAVLRLLEITNVAQAIPVFKSLKDATG